jgi:hypothetical protein
MNFVIFMSQPARIKIITFVAQCLGGGAIMKNDICAGQQMFDNP